jgi:hypothetical protein
MTSTRIAAALSALVVAGGIGVASVQQTTAPTQDAAACTTQTISQTKQVSGNKMRYLVKQQQVCISGFPPKVTITYPSYTTPWYVM